LEQRALWRSPRRCAYRPCVAVGPPPPDQATVSAYGPLPCLGLGPPILVMARAKPNTAQCPMWSTWRSGLTRPGATMRKNPPGGSHDHPIFHLDRLPSECAAAATDEGGRSSIC